MSNFTNALTILTYLKTMFTNGISTINVNLDEPLEIVYNDLNTISIYPIKEDFLYDESYGQDKKSLALRVEVRMKGGPASTVATPVLNQITALLKSDLHLGGLADYMELETVQWGNDRIEQGLVCGCSLDLTIKYLI